MKKESKQPPVKEGDKIIVTIDNIGRKGDGVARYEGYAIIIPETIKNKKYLVEITNVYPSYAFANKKEYIQEG